MKQSNTKTAEPPNQMPDLLAQMSQEANAKIQLEAIICKFREQVIELIINHDLKRA